MRRGEYPKVMGRKGDGTHDGEKPREEEMEQGET